MSEPTARAQCGSQTSLHEGSAVDAWLPLGSAKSVVQHSLQTAQRTQRETLEALHKRSPLWVAAGPWSSGEQSTAPLASAGAVIAKTVTAEPREGNAPPVLQRWSGSCGGYLNRIGLRNVGAQAFVQSRLPVVQACQAPVIQSFTAQREDEVEAILQAFADQAIVGFELNASCPNAASGQLDDEVLRRVLRCARRHTPRPIWVKLAYAPAEILRTRARICADEGADGITAINTMPALSVTPRERQAKGAGDGNAPAVDLFRGGLSGPALTPLVQWAVDFLVREQPLPVVACGGVQSLREVLALAALGAFAVQVGSALLDDAGLLARLQGELCQLADRYQVTSWTALVEALCPHNRS